jgi:hypothetical protein
MIPSSSRASTRATVLASLYVGALALWVGGLVTLGAIVAPTVFRTVAAPANADAMTTVFRRFDAVAIGCAVVALGSEAAVGFLLSGAQKREDRTRILAILGASGLATLEAVWLSPSIQALHQAGAVRRVGDAGEALDRLHGIAERCAKLELFLLAIVLVLLVRRVARIGAFGTGRA